MSASVTNFYLNRKTPGVYITQIPATGGSVVGVPTAVPVFVGYTQFAGDPTTGLSLYNTPVELSSLSDFTQHFGGAAPAPFAVTVLSNADPAVPPVPDFSALFTTGDPSPVATMTGFRLTLAAIPGKANQFNLFWSMMLFFANGGGSCFVISVGSYWAGETPASAAVPVPENWSLNTIKDIDLMSGVTAASHVIGPTMLVVPEACQLQSTATVQAYDNVVSAMLNQAGTLQDRVAIIDPPNCLAATTMKQLQDTQTTLAKAIASSIRHASYGVCYAPALNATVVSANDILYTSLVATDLEGNRTVNNILTSQAVALFSDPTRRETLQCAIASAFPLPGSLGFNTNQYSGSAIASNGGTSYPPPPPDGAERLKWQTTLDSYLQTVLPVFEQIKQLIANAMNVLPPSGALAGIYAQNDAERGVWNAPANVSANSVASPRCPVTDDQQAGFNVPLNGQAINLIRAFPGRGSLVWGARTLDGNSNDYRYVQVRRTLIYVEQSIKLALQSFVFAANDATTWSTVAAEISSFLTGLWQSGGLMGAKASDAFSVQCGLGSTMTSQNVLDGTMIVAVTLQMVHPAEFIELTFTQSMGS